MEKIILIKYGELTTKKANRNLFINNLFINSSPIILSSSQPLLAIF